MSMILLPFMIWGLFARASWRYWSFFILAGSIHYIWQPPLPLARPIDSLSTVEAKELFYIARCYFLPALISAIALSLETSRRGQPQQKPPLGVLKEITRFTPPILIYSLFFAWVIDPAITPPLSKALSRDLNESAGTFRSAPKVRSSQTGQADLHRYSARDAASYRHDAAPIESLLNQALIFKRALSHRRNTLSDDRSAINTKDHSSREAARSPREQHWSSPDIDGTFERDNPYEPWEYVHPEGLDIEVAFPLPPQKSRGQSLIDGANVDHTTLSLNDESEEVTYIFRATSYDASIKRSDEESQVRRAVYFWLSLLEYPAQKALTLQEMNPSQSGAPPDDFSLKGHYIDFQSQEEATGVYGRILLSEGILYQMIMLYDIDAQESAPTLFQRFTSSLRRADSQL